MKRTDLIDRPQAQSSGWSLSAGQRFPGSKTSLARKWTAAKQSVPRGLLRCSRTISCKAELASGSGGGGGKDIPPRWSVNEDDPFFGESRDNESDAILAKSGVDAQSLPADIQDALRRGAVSGKELELLLKINSTAVLGAICRALPFIRDRVIGNPRFLLVLAIEEVIGVTAKMAAEFQGRKEEFWNELHFVASDIALEVIGDFAVVCLLSPKANFGQRPKSGISRAINGLPGHAFQIGNYSLLQRLSTVVYRGAQFFSVGFASSALGHGLTKWSVEKKQLANPKKDGEEPYKPLAPVLENSAAWGGFMALSTNARYQLLNGIEERGLEVLIQSGPLKAAITFVMRFGNTFFGGAQWVWYARAVGLQ